MGFQSSDSNGSIFAFFSLIFEHLQSSTWSVVQQRAEDAEIGGAL